jgi:hypothetical protein
MEGIASERMADSSLAVILHVKMAAAGSRTSVNQSDARQTIPEVLSTGMPSHSDI